MSLFFNHDAAVLTETLLNNFHTTFAPREMEINLEKLKLNVSEARVVADDQQHLASHFRKELQREKKITEVLKMAIVDLQCHTKKLIADINHLQSREKEPSEARARNSLPGIAKLASNILATSHELDENMSNLSKCSTVTLKETMAFDLKAEINSPSNNDNTYQSNDRLLTFREMEIKFGKLKLEFAEINGTIEKQRHLVAHLKKELYIERKITGELKSVIDNLQHNLKNLMVVMDRLLREKESEEKTEMRENGENVVEDMEKKSDKVMEEQDDFRDRSKESILEMSKHLKISSQKSTLKEKCSNSTHGNKDWLKSYSHNKDKISGLGAKDSELKFGATKTWMNVHCDS